MEYKYGNLSYMDETGTGSGTLNDTVYYIIVLTISSPNSPRILNFEQENLTR